METNVTNEQTCHLIFQQTKETKAYENTRGESERMRRMNRRIEKDENMSYCLQLAFTC